MPASSRRDGRDVVYRFLSPEEDVDTITALLHRAYAPLAEAGLRFMASHQSADLTRRRMALGDTVVAVSDGRVIGVITLARAAATSGAPFYDRPDVASFGQFAVEPVYQGSGVGSTLLDFVEALALEHGVSHLGLDTAEQAAQLIRFYTKRGYQFVEHVRWPDVNYRSVILTKPILPTTSSRGVVKKLCGPMGSG